MVVNLGRTKCQKVKVEVKKLKRERELIYYHWKKVNQCDMSMYILLVRLTLGI